MIVTFESQNKHAEAMVISVLVVDAFSNGPSNQVAPAAKVITVAALEVLLFADAFCPPIIS